MKNYLKRVLSHLFGGSSKPITLGSAGPGMMYYTFSDEEGNLHVQPRDWVYSLDAGGKLTREPRPTIQRQDAEGNVYFEPVWVPTALRLSSKEYSEIRLA